MFICHFIIQVLPKFSENKSKLFSSMISILARAHANEVDNVFNYTWDEYCIDAIDNSSACYVVGDRNVYLDENQL